MATGSTGHSYSHMRKLAHVLATVCIVTHTHGISHLTGVLWVTKTGGGNTSVSHRAVKAVNDLVTTCEQPCRWGKDPLCL